MTWRTVPECRTCVPGPDVCDYCLAYNLMQPLNASGIYKPSQDDGYHCPFCSKDDGPPVPGTIFWLLPGWRNGNWTRPDRLLARCEAHKDRLGTVKNLVRLISGPREFLVRRIMES